MKYKNNVGIVDRLVKDKARDHADHPTVLSASPDHDVGRLRLEIGGTIQTFLEMRTANYPSVRIYNTCTCTPCRIKPSIMTCRTTASSSAGTFARKRRSRAMLTPFACREWGRFLLEVQTQGRVPSRRPKEKAVARAPSRASRKRNRSRR